MRIYYNHIEYSRILYKYKFENSVLNYTIKGFFDYFPYGKTLRFYNPEEEKYLTTQHQRDTETSFDYRGARFYDADIARFLSVDPLAVKYPNFSSYIYVADNPMIYTDPDGKKIRIFYTETIQKKNRTITKNRSIVLKNWNDVNGAVEKTNGNEFVKNITKTMKDFKGKDKITGYKDGVFDMLLDSKKTVNVIEQDLKSTDATDNSVFGSGSYNMKSNSITWDPKFGSESLDVNGEVTGTRSPGMILVEESIHAVRDVVDGYEPTKGEMGFDYYTSEAEEEKVNSLTNEVAKQNNEGIQNSYRSERRSILVK